MLTDAYGYSHEQGYTSNETKFFLQTCLILLNQINKVDSCDALTDYLLSHLCQMVMDDEISIRRLKLKSMISYLVKEFIQNYSLYKLTLNDVESDVKQIKYVEKKQIRGVTFHPLPLEESKPIQLYEYENEMENLEKRRQQVLRHYEHERNKYNDASLSFASEDLCSGNGENCYENEKLINSKQELQSMIHETTKLSFQKLDQYFQCNVDELRENMRYQLTMARLVKPDIGYIREVLDTPTKNKLNSVKKDGKTNKNLEKKIGGKGKN
ncbi:unnamed protein product [Didymodactylos carnosus]|uniref:Uncharacterized protein n=1 Tax=Didymodactylos carnosus TaxID=1234261 RepID=A0A813W348_9BILA|nr:unnamed protein product [Didymodactylos carnosus]CAF0849288.1 unnamed protein product [Didymodactylos carnosus]CAF3607331.1 unnamed protein product [Didymodactylos carnosus]CAF3636790.1 unnamed protein product [Didymodactylos carnosus]